MGSDSIMASDFHSSPMWIKGHSGELLVANLLREDGWFVIPSYAYTGQQGDKAPKMKGLQAAYVIPDLDISRNGERRWAEVKTKECATFTRITQQSEHGIPLRHFDDYKRVQSIGGCKVYLFILEENTAEILFRDIDYLDSVKRVYLGDKMNNGGMVFFPRAAFELYGTLKGGNGNGNGNESETTAS